jgi:hypothetical protein
MNLFRLIFPLSCCVLLPLTSSWALSLKNFHNQFSTSLGVMSQDYVEPDTKNVIANKDYLDKEYGNTLALSLWGSLYTPPYYLSISSEFYYGFVTYDGHYQEPYEPVIDKTGYDITVLSTKAGWVLPLNKQADVIVAIEGRYEQWQRDLGFKETYDHIALNAVIQADWIISNQYVFSLDAHFGSFIYSNITVPYVNLNEALGHDPFTRFGLTFNTTITPQITGYISWHQEKFSYSESDKTVTALHHLGQNRLFHVWEPASKTQRTMFLVGIRLLR